MVKHTVSVSSLFLFSSFSLVFSVFPSLPKPTSKVDGPLFLTPYIERGEFEMARLLSYVPPFLGNVQSHSGFLTVNKECNSNMFFWYFKAQNNNPNAPIVVWLQGGPGQSSLRGLFSEVGPYRLTVQNNFELNKFSLNREVSMIFFDNPIGTGYSFSTEGCYPKDQSKIGKELLIALKQLLSVFTSGDPNPVYIIGEDFGGKFATALAYAISNDRTVGESVNLRGLAIGNPVIDPEIQFQHSDFLYNISLIDDRERLEFKKEEDRCRSFIRQKSWQEAFVCFDQAILGLIARNTTFTKLTGFKYYGHYLYSDPQPEGNWRELATLDEMRRLIHVGSLTFNDGRDVLLALKEDIPKSVRPTLEQLLNTEKYGILVYSGQQSILCPGPLTERYLMRLNWPGAYEFKTANRDFWYVKGKLAGYLKLSKNLREVVIRNAGNMAPMDQPEYFNIMMTRYLINEFQ